MWWKDCRPMIEDSCAGGGLKWGPAQVSGVTQNGHTPASAPVNSVDRTIAFYLTTESSSSVSGAEIWCWVAVKSVDIDCLLTVYSVGAQHLAHAIEANPNSGSNSRLVIDNMPSPRFTP
jgi:hypothetical protein